MLAKTGSADETRDPCGSGQRTPAGSRSVRLRPTTLGDDDVYIITCGVFKEQRGFFTCDKSGEVKEVDLNGQVFNPMTTFTWQQLPHDFESRCAHKTMGCLCTRCRRGKPDGKRFCHRHLS